MIDLKKLEVWFVTGSQQLYGPETLKQVAVNAREIAAGAGRRGGDPGDGRIQAGGEDAGGSRRRFARKPTPQPRASGWSPGAIRSRRPRCGSMG